MDDRLKHARDHLAGTQRAQADAERRLRAERERLGNSGQIYAEKTLELGHTITRFHGDIAATFAPFMAGTFFHGRVVNPRRGGGR